jgi:adenine-specific DNA-methyltransferase
MPRYEGRLELTWTNKHERLLAHEDGSYEWVNPADYRVAEVRLLHDAASVAEVGKTRARDNLLIRGDALNALTSLARLPEFAKHYLGKVKLTYIDPPFNTKESRLQYDDNLEHSVWLTMMRDRLLQIRDLLAAEGSVWLHVDDSEMHRARCVMDEVFGPQAFVATVIWQKKYSRDNRPAIGAVHDYLLVYAPMGDDWKHHRNRITRLEAKQYRNPNNDPRGRWRPIPLTAQAGHATPAQFYEVTTPGGAVHPPPKGRCWSVTKERMGELIDEGRVYFGKDGKSQPNLIRYLDEDEGLVPWTWWPHEEVGHNDESKKEMLALFPDKPPFDTPKPERLMQRIIEIATDPGEVVLDCFVGSGTTAAVAHKLARRWVAADWERETVENYAFPRLTSVIQGSDPGGITEAVEWQGGGGFRVLDVAPSMFEADGGMVFLAEWMTNGALAEATAAQLLYTYEDAPPFCGRKGRARLAVVDGIVNESVVRLLVNALPENEKVVICGTGIDVEARPILRQLSPGSTMRKIPAALLDEYRSSSQLRLDLSPAVPESPGGNGAVKSPSEVGV